MWQAPIFYRSGSDTLTTSDDKCTRHRPSEINPTSPHFFFNVFDFLVTSHLKKREKWGLTRVDLQINYNAMQCDKLMP